MGVKQTVGKGCRAGLGLRKNLQGINRPLTPIKNEERFGLGYKPTKEERRKLAARKKVKKMAQLEGKKEEFGKQTISHLYETFRSAGFIHPEAPTKVNQVLRMFDELSIHMIKDEKPNEKIPVVYPILLGDELSDWTATELAIIFKSLEMSLNDEHEDNLNNNSNIDFEMIPNVDELKNEEEVDDYGLPPNLSRMLKLEEREILPHQELTEMINLENGEEKKEVKIDTLLSSNERQKLEKLLCEYVDVFAWSYQDMPGLNTDIVVHKLPLRSDWKPIKQKLRRMKPEMLLKIKEEVKKQFDAGFLEMAKYPEWVANIVPVPKKDGKLQSDQDGTRRYGKNDVRNHVGNVLLQSMPFGLKNAGATYQRAMVALFHDMMHKEIKVYVDDMIAKSHTVNLKKLFERLRKFQLKLNPAKCTFGVTYEKLLGFILTCKCDPFFKLLRKRDPGEWNEECQIAFDKIKEYLKNPPVLVPPTVEKPLILYLTVNKNSMRCVLGQHDGTGKKEQAIYYLSKKFMEYESKYSTLEKMCCALAWIAQRLRQYMLYHTTWLVAKLEPIKYIFEKPFLSGRIARWQVLLSEYDIVYLSQKSIKGSAIADFLADRANEDYESVSFDFRDEDLMVVLHIEKKGPNELNPWKMYFDGAANALGHEIGAVLISPNGKYYPATTRLNFNCTNNIAEYEALVMGLQAAIKMRVGAIEVYEDSALVICQMRENHIVDALATFAAMFKIKEVADVRLFDLEVREISAHYLNVEEEVDGKPWYHDIMQYIKHQAYLENATDNDKRTLKRLAMGFFLSGEVLYKRSQDQVLLRCVDATEANKIMEEVHKGTCGAHANGHMLVRQIMRAGYYWLTLESDCINFVRRCHKCQIYADRIHAPSAPLHIFTAHWPFSMWGMDVIGLITPKASNGY
ncbi:PREDICTED: uncharacterized protein LOC108663639 [Theobroma cacao]|uniref:Uncharacterized protein LOC108663639 n=1 Tax=Theobroma cacao TaxID=3641 RepID=A0AB32X0U4_THECC|nr:PREDICTED: uncharacterized protein LOC108663639 [Theobroma cacao]